jgi:hypothetical protein
MEYKITNRQHLLIFNKVYNYIEDMIDLDEWSLIKAGVGGYEGIYELINQEYETFFVIYMPEYWSEDTQEGLNMKSKSPILRLEKDFEKHLTNMFGRIWEEPMKSFVKNNFNIEIKSIGF